VTDENARIGAVIDEMYAMISGPAGPRDWGRQAAIFHPDVRQMRTGVDESGKPRIKIMSRDEYRENTAPFFAENAFYEVEIARRIDVFGNMAHVWSAYEARTALDDAKPERRGVNSIQLYRDETGRWQIISMIWDNERDGLTLSLPIRR
jgi:hypothetical protein